MNKTAKAEPSGHAPGDDQIIGAAVTGSVIVLAVLLTAGAGAWWYLSRKPAVQDVQKQLVLPRARQVADAPLPMVPFVEITKQAGIDFVHENGAVGAKLLPETMGGGCAFLDFDGDDDQDLLLINSTHWPWDDAPQQRPASALYANQGGKFVDVSAETGIDKLSLYGMGAAVADYDNDGDTDIYVTAVGNNVLLRNDDGKFVDVTSDAGAAGGHQWSTSAGWLDYDNDGLLDLFVCNYVDWSREIDLGQSFKLDGVGRAYGPPKAFDGTFPTLLHNEGQGRFRDVSAEAGVQVRNPLTDKPAGKSMGLAPVDYDGDGWIDIVVANDTVQNFVFHNLADGRFEEVGIKVGVAVGSDGKPRGAMGIDSARSRNNESLAVAIGNYSNEMTSLFITDPKGRSFEDAALSTGLGPQTRLDLTFGVCFLDVDLDGRLDLLCANGHLEEEINKVLRSQHYEQPAQLFWNHGPGHSAEFVAFGQQQCGADLKRPMVGRGATFADIDGDGDLDLLLTSSGGPPRLLRNDQRLGNHWLRIRLEGVSCNRDAIGAWITVRAGKRSYFRQVMPTRSYLSQSELPVTIGFGPDVTELEVVVDWPGGGRQLLSNVPVDHHLTIRQAAADEPMARRFPSNNRE